MRTAGLAKKFLAQCPSEYWEQCKTELKQHFRATKDQDFNLRVGNIIEINRKAKNYGQHN